MRCASHERVDTPLHVAFRRDESRPPVLFAYKPTRQAEPLAQTRRIERQWRGTDIHVSVPFVSNLPRHLKEYVAPSFAAKVNGAPVLVTGETMPFEDSLTTHFTLDVNALDVRKYLAYLPMPIPAKVDSGTLDAHVTVRFTQGSKAATVEAAGTAALTQVSLTTDSGKLPISSAAFS